MKDGVKGLDEVNVPLFIITNEEPKFNDSEKYKEIEKTDDWVNNDDSLKDID